LIPCLLWVSFLSALNFSIWHTNPAGAAIQIVSQRIDKVDDPRTVATDFARTYCALSKKASSNLLSEANLLSP
jgi:hypothetical protein